MIDQESQTLLNFPERFPIKAFGEDTPEFIKSINATFQRHVDSNDIIDTRHSKSSKGNYISITTTITARSQEQLDAIYRDLTENKLVKMAL